MTPRLPASRIPASIGRHWHSLAEAPTYKDRCRACGTQLHPIAAPTGYHELCWPGPLEAYDDLVMPLTEYRALKARQQIGLVR